MSSENKKFKYISNGIILEGEEARKAKEEAEKKKKLEKIEILANENEKLHQKFNVIYEEESKKKSDDQFPPNSEDDKSKKQQNGYALSQNYNPLENIIKKNLSNLRMNQTPIKSFEAYKNISKNLVDQVGKYISDNISLISKKIDFENYKNNINNDQKNNKIDYIEWNDMIAEDFQVVILKYLQETKNTNLESKILNELVELNQEKEEIIKLNFNERKKEILRAIIYLYSIEKIIYDKFNERLASRKYRELLNTLTTTYKEIIYNPQYTKYRQANGVILFRGIRESAKQLPRLLKYWQKNTRPLFFPAFTSSTPDSEEAAKFSDGIIFRILLSKSDPHPHFTHLKKGEFSPYDEHETLIFSYFPFYIEKIEENVEFIKGSTRKTMITLIQDEKAPVFSEDLDKMKAFWNQWIKNLLKIGGKNNILEEILTFLNELNLKNPDIDNAKYEDAVKYIIDFVGKKYAKEDNCTKLPFQRERR